MKTARNVGGNTPALGIRPTGAILLAFLLLYFLSAVLLKSLIQGNANWLSSVLSFGEDGATAELLYGGLMKALDPWLLLAVTVYGLKSYLPHEQTRDIFIRYGFGKIPKARVLLAAFIIGALLLQLFLHVLIPHFTRAESLIPSAGEKLNALPQWFKWVIALSTISIVPVAEEFMFRGMLYTCIAEAWNVPAAIVISTVIFIALHPEGLASGNMLTHAALLVGTLALAFARLITKSLYVPVMLHAGFNFSSIFLH